MNEARKYDLIVWGATGFTGRLVAEYLAGRDAGSDLNWAIAGRSRERLEALREELDQDTLPIVVADSHDEESLTAMARQTRVVCTTVGPYALYGSSLVEVCARSGTHYCDLCGEVPWMRRMIDAWSETARDSGARIVHACGFDSIPSDMGVFYLQQQAMAGGRPPLDQIRFRLRAARGAASGGTVASLLNAVEEGRKDREQARVLVKPYSLNPPGERTGPDRRDQAGPVYDPTLRSWTAPFVMAAINTKVVRRSNALMGYPWGRNFRYEEAMLTGPGLAGRAKAAAISAGLGAFLVASSIKPVRGLMQRLFLPDPGEGPDQEKREAGFYNIQLVGQWNDGETLLARVRGDRDPGYGSTSKMLAESAICLATDELEVEGGFWTPSSAMGHALLQRLSDHAGLSFEIESDRPADQS